MALVVFTGGARSGKSSAATELARVRALDGSRVVVAVFGDPGADAEMSARIARHKLDRPSGFESIEAEDALSWLDAVDDGCVLVVDCLGTLVARIMGEAGEEAPMAAVESRVDEVVARLLARVGDTIVVTNEVGDGVVPAYASGRAFRDVLGRANRMLVRAADAAYLVVCGRLIDLATAPMRAVWPAD